MQYLLFEDHSRFDLMPLSWTRPAYEFLVGIDTLREKWGRYLGQAPATYAYDFLGAKFSRFDPVADTLWINGKFIPDESLLQEINSACGPNEFWLSEQGEILAARFKPELLGEGPGKLLSQELLLSLSLTSAGQSSTAHKALRQLTDIFHLNGACIQQDFNWLRSRMSSNPVTDKHSVVYGADNIFIGQGVKMRAAILNAEDGPIWLGDGSVVEEGGIIHGTHAICANSTVKMGAKLRGDTTIGPWSKVGGEVANSVIMGWSNKGHDGYLGNSVLGHWCNLGADTNTSNLKNNYAEVKLWNYVREGFARTGTQFCGLIMGDHSKCGINTMFNTGTVIGVSANIFGAGYPRNFIPSFSWGGSSGYSVYALKKALEVAKIVMARRNIELDEIESQILETVFKQSAQYRNF